jgi:3-phenylpropionate/trans-cinnamate dioxygenase ferredoxin reductase subunit
MNGSHVKYLIVGGGLAASSAAEAIRSRDARGSLMLVGQEVNRPYHRPPLSKGFLRREKSLRDISTLPADWFEQNRCELSTGRRATNLDTSRRMVALDSGEEISFDKLLLATGASPAPLKIPGADLPNVFYIRTVKDVDRLHHAVDQALAAGQPHDRGRGVAGVIGAGVLGVEIAASLTQMGLHVELIHGGAHPWEKFAGENLGRFIGRTLTERGTVLRAAQRPESLEGDGRLQRVVLPSGERLRCDLVVAAVGINVNRELLRGTSISAEKAILCDDHCRTNVQDIYAAGDCAAIFDPLFGKHRILDHWDNARVTGAIAGANMAGDGTVSYDGVNYFFSDVFDISLWAWGEARLVHHRIVRGTPTLERPEMIEFGIASDGRIAQVLALNYPGKDDTLKELVRRRLDLTGREEAAKDPAESLAQLLA